MEQVIFKLLQLKTLLLNIFYNIKNKITNTTRFVIDKENELYRYYLIQLLTSIRNMLSKVIESLDKSGKLVECTKVNDNKSITMILNTRKFDSMTNVIEYLNQKNYIPQITPNVFLKFQLQIDEDTTHCMKDFILRYNDPEKLFDNTLQNILEMNGININIDDNITINATLFKDFKMIPITIPYSQYKDYHLNNLLEDLYSR